MYQYPVRGIEKIRKTRRKVKNILSEFGLEQCLSLSEGLQSFDPGDTVYNATEWNDLADGYDGKWKKKWEYRTRGLCCSLCKFSTRSWYSFRAHIHRCHDEEQRLCSLSVCSGCPFIAHPKVIAKHYKLFHAEPPKPEYEPVPQQQQQQQLPTKAIGSHIFQCRKCPFNDTLLYSMKKHVLINHYTSLLNRFAAQRTESELHALGPMYQKFFCKVCGANAETSEHLLYHILTSEKHKELEFHINVLIFETDNKKMFPALAPKAQGSPVIAGPTSQPIVTPVPPPGAVMPGVANGGPRLYSPPGQNPAVLPAQASALVQLASAEAKGLLQPGQPMNLHNVQAARAGPATVPVMGGMAAPPAMHPVMPHQQLPVRLGVPGQMQPPSRQVLVPPGMQFNVPSVRGPPPPPPTPQSLIVSPRFPVNQPTPRGTMLTSQSLLSHLIPTGNKVDGLPTYTLAPLHVLSVRPNNMQMANNAPLPVPHHVPTLQHNALASNGSQDSKQTKRWVTCPVCNELFPSSIYESHVEVHKEASKKTKLGLAARAPFLKKMPDKTVKCLMCKILLSEKGLFEHLLHGLNCLYCSGMFYSLKQLVAHIQMDHNPNQKANCDFMRREYRLYTDESGSLLFPYFDINTTAPKEMMGEKELNLALVTNSLDLIFLKMLPASPQQVCKMPMPKPDSLDCVFCSEKQLNMECYQLHLREKHYIVPTLHAILKSPAYKCVYCGGVYTGKTTEKAISVHISKCRSAPKTPRDAERIMSSGLAVAPRGSQGLLSFPPPPRQSSIQVPAPVQASVPAIQSPHTAAELQSKLRLELAVKEAIAANKKEREARLARKRKLERDRLAGLTPPSPDMQVDPSVQFALDPAGMDIRSFEDRRDFVNKYFNKQPYPLKKEIIALSNRLLLNKTDIACQFGSKRTRCMKHLQKNRAAVLLGFKMTELLKLKHDLVIPQIEPEKTSADTEPESPGSESAGSEPLESETQDPDYMEPESPEAQTPDPENMEQDTPGAETPEQNGQSEEAREVD
ncbi:activity-dependent neuroprotector homeobox protein 2-like [Astyanax mexicanus]|uniref:Activity-dependent neuroprotector homeobox protein 2-like n=1 Tax=Astyanax mexicanus TaxID=7994 RepID=A0A8B9HA01_ASTMX|nr:activity-dependent neuroprotector homeobox protein 2-like [Astyanax mexicanus]